jgi:phage-related protein
MITLGIDGSEAKKGINDVTKSLQSGLSSMTSLVTGFGAALAGAFSVGAAFSTWKEQASELGEMSKRLHMGMTDLQGWTGAVGKFGGSASDFENSLRGLNAQLAKMAVLGKSRTGTFLQSLGIDPGELGRQRDALQVLEELSGVMEQMSPDEARSAGQALGFDASMIMLLQQGRDGMKELIRQKKEDAIYTQEDADAVKQYTVEMGKLKKGFMGIMGVLFRAIMPAFTKITAVFGKFVNFIRKQQTTLKIFFIMIAALITGLLIPTLWRLFATLLANPFTWIVAGLVLLAMALEDLWGWMNGKDAEFAKTWEALFGSPEEAKKKFDEYLTMFWEFTDKVAEQLDKFRRLIGDNSGMAMLGAGIVVFAGLVKTVLWPVFQLIGKGVKGAIKAITELPKAVKVIKDVFWGLRMVGTMVLKFLGTILKSIRALFMSNPITAAIMVIITVLMDLFEWVTTGESMFDDLWKAMFGDPAHFKEIMDDIGKFFKDAWDGAIKWVEEKWEGLKTTVGEIIDWILDKWNALTGKSASVSVDTEGATEPVDVSAEMEMPDISSWAESIKNDIADSLSGLWEDATATIDEMWDGVTDAVSNTWNEITDTISNAIDSIADMAGSIWDGFTDNASSVWASIADTISTAWETVTSAIAQIWGNLIDALQEGLTTYFDFAEEILSNLLDVAEQTWEDIQQAFMQAIKVCIEAWGRFSSAGIAAISSLLGPVANLASSIRTNIIGAIDDASIRWQAFQAEMAAGSMIVASAGDYSSGGGNYSNTSNTEWNVTLNGIQNGQQAASDFRQGVGSRFSATNFNPGIR